MTVHAISTLERYTAHDQLQEGSVLLRSGTLTPPLVPLNLTNFSSDWQSIENCGGKENPGATAGERSLRGNQTDQGESSRAARQTMKTHRCGNNMLGPEQLPIQRFVCELCGAKFSVDMPPPPLSE